MIGDLFVNFSKVKALNVHVKETEKNAEIEFEDGSTGLQVRLSKEQIAQLRGVLENSTTERRSL